MAKNSSEDIKIIMKSPVILKKIALLIGLFIIIYFEISTFLVSAPVVGSVGHIFAIYSIRFFGYMAYIYPLFLVYILYVINKSINISDLIIKSTNTILLVFTFLVFQALIVEGEYQGEIGNIIVTSFMPYIGNLGLWIFVLTCFVASMLVIVEDKQHIINNAFNNIQKFFTKDASTQKAKVQVVQKVKSEPKIVAQAPKATTKKIVEDKNDTPLSEVSQTTYIKNDDTKIQSQIDFEDEDFEIEEVEVQTNEYVHVNDKKTSLIVDELEENTKLLSELELGKVEKPKDFKLPPSSFFAAPPSDNSAKINEAVIDQKIADLLEKLLMFKIEGDVVRTYTGPVVTTFEFKPAPNVKVSKILNLQDDLAMALKAQTIRIQAPIPGKDVVGIEVPNEDVQTIYLREILDSELFQSSKSGLTMILGKDIVGKPFVTDLKKLPHLLIAGTTGSGKSVGINSMILSLLYKNSPDNLKLIMIDPKMLEFSMYNDIPHLLTPVITKATEAINALANMVAEMERRYTLMSQTKTKNIESYNDKAKREGFEEFPYIVIIIDELADLMMTSGKEVELSIARLAQMARASGIHLIVATQRPSVDVVTGLIKANLPSRISYKVGQKIDSKIILDSMGAESLLGRGDMLFTPPGTSGLVRIHAPWSSEKEIENVVDFLKAQREVSYDFTFLKASDGATSEGGSNGGDIGELDELYDEAKNVVLSEQKSSISHIQRRLRIGYNRAATIVEQLEATGVLSAPNIKGNREILI